MTGRRLTTEKREQLKDELKSHRLSWPALGDALRDLDAADAEIARFKTTAFQAQEMAKELTAKGGRARKGGGMSTEEMRRDLAKATMHVMGLPKGFKKTVSLALLRLAHACLRRLESE